MTNTSEEIKQEIADLKFRLAAKERLLEIQEALEAAEQAVDAEPPTISLSCVSYSRVLNLLLGASPCIAFPAWQQTLEYISSPRRVCGSCFPERH